MPTVKEAIKRLNWAKGQHVAVAIWCEEDVIERAKEKGVILGHKPAAEIMDAVDHDHDCELGITWDTLNYYIDEFKREHPHYHRCSEEEGEEEEEEGRCPACGLLTPLCVCQRKE